MDDSDRRMKGRGGYNVERGSLGGREKKCLTMEVDKSSYRRRSMRRRRSRIRLEEECVELEKTHSIIPTFTGTSHSNNDSYHLLYAWDDTIYGWPFRTSDRSERAMESSSLSMHL